MSRAPITTEILHPVDLCNADGRLNPDAIGWSRHPQHRDNLTGRPLRKKRWDYWCVMGDNFALSVVIANVDYLALAGLYVLEYDTGLLKETGVVLPFSRRVQLTETVGGHNRFHSRILKLDLRETEGGVRIDVDCKRLAGAPLTAEINIARPPHHETLNVVIPWNERTFQFTSKQNCMPSEGTVKWGDRNYRFNPETAFAVLDYGRGIWPYRTSWNWAVFSGPSGDDTVGINMGAKWTDGTGANENGIFLNGVLYKLFEDIAFTYDDRDFMKPWRMRTTESDAVDLTFTPFHDKPGKLNLVILSTRVHQCFGRYSGSVKADGRTIPVDNLLGWAEEHHARW